MGRNPHTQFINNLGKEVGEAFSLGILVWVVTIMLTALGDVTGMFELTNGMLSAVATGSAIGLPLGFASFIIYLVAVSKK
jgi:hypothetical protein